MRKALCILTLGLFFFNGTHGQEQKKDLYLHLLVRGESVVKNKGHEKNAFAFRTLIAREKTFAFDLSSNFGKKGVTSIGIGFPLYWEHTEKRKMIFLPMIYRHFGKFQGTGAGFTVEYDDHRFYWLSTVSMSMGKNVYNFYGPFLINAGVTINKIVIGGDFETIYSPDESEPGQEPQRSLEVYMGPFVKWAEPIKIGNKHLSLELGYGHNIVKKENHRILLTLLIE